VPVEVLQGNCEFAAGFLMRDRGAGSVPGGGLMLAQQQCACRR